MTSRIILIAFLLAAALFTAGQPPRVYAETPDEASATFVAPHYCNDIEETAGVMQAEMGAQRIDTIITGMQILVNEAASRGITVCALTHLTNFTSVPAYARHFPDSYQAYQYTHPREEMLILAQAVLHGELEDRTQGMRHFDGTPDGNAIIFRP